MPSTRVGDKYYSEEEYRQYKEDQSRGAVILVSILFGGAFGYELAKHFELSKIFVFLSVIFSALFSGILSAMVAKYLVILVKIIVGILIVGGIGAIIWFLI